MLRLLAGTVLALALTGCWLSEQRLFGAGDWAALDVAGHYVSENAEGNREARVVLKVLPNRTVEGTSTRIDDGSVETSVFGLVPIAGGAGSHFIMLDRSGETDDGDIYFIAHLTGEGAIEVYFPQCAGTPDIAGMTRESDPWISEEICHFTDKPAVMRAALEAERVLSTPQMFEIRRLARLVPVDETEASEP